MIDSSPPSSSAESSFRELDEVFLQTQTRIWLGELLNTRLDEDLPLPDLLQDGEILYQVSKVVWDLLITKCMELRHLKHKYGPFGSKKSSGRYRPYSNVDSFLKICKILGLSGIDLFSPSDVVEKRNIRKVCICIRALSKKARSKQLSAPDFDMVIYSVTMPTDMVGVIRRSLESPQCTFSSSSSYSSPKGSKMKLKEKNSYAPDNRDDDSSSSDESDEAESRYMGENAFSSQCNFDNAGGVDSDLEDSSENLVESDVKCRCTEECKSASDLDKASSCCSNSNKKPYHGISHVDSEDRQTNTNGDADVSDMNFILENDDLFMGDSSCIDAGENNYIANYLAFSDLMVHATTEGSSNSVVLDGENNMFDFFVNVDPQGVTMGDKSFHNGSQRIYSDDEDMEVSSTTSMSSVLGRLLNLEFDNQFDDDDSSSTNVRSSLSKELESKELDKDSSLLSEPPKEGIQLFDSQEDETCRDVVVANDSLERHLSCEDEDKESNATVILDSERFSGQVENIAVEDSRIQDATPQVVSEEDTNSHNSNISSADESGGQDKRDSQKHKRRPLLKTVAKGTAIAGIIFLLLHIRKSNGSIAQERKQSSQTSTKFSSSGKQQKRSEGKGVYPTEKIKLGN